MTPNELIEYALSSNEESKCYGQELCGAFRKGYPISNLRRLLVSENDEAKRLGAYLAYELGSLVRPLVDDIVSLLDHHEPQVRFDAIYALTDCTSHADFKALGRAFLLLDDPHPFVHRGVIHLIRYSERWQLSLATREAAKAHPGSVFETAIYKSLSSGSFNKSTLAELVSHESPIVRRFAAGMACRPRCVIDEEFLEIGKNCQDDEGLFAIESVRERTTPIDAVHGRLLYRVNDVVGRRRTRRDSKNSSELEGCQDKICLDKPEKFVPKLLQKDRGVFYPSDMIIADNEAPYSHIEIAWLDEIEEPIDNFGYVNIMFRDVRTYETRYAVFNLNSL